MSGFTSIRRCATVVAGVLAVFASTTTNSQAVKLGLRKRGGDDSGFEYEDIDDVLEKHSVDLLDQDDPEKDALRCGNKNAQTDTPAKESPKKTGGDDSGSEYEIINECMHVELGGQGDPEKDAVGYENEAQTDTLAKESVGAKEGSLLHQAEIVQPRQSGVFRDSDANPKSEASQDVESIKSEIVNPVSKQGDADQPVAENVQPEEEPEKCAICLNNLGANDEDIEVCENHHKFHKHCIRPWAQDPNHQTCPECRAKITEEALAELEIVSQLQSAPKNPEGTLPSRSEEACTRTQELLLVLFMCLVAFLSPLLYK